MRPEGCLYRPTALNCDESTSFQSMLSDFMALKISDMMSCGRLRDRMPRCHLDRFFFLFSAFFLFI